jgi:hypothetical protein
MSFGVVQQIRRHEHPYVKTSPDTHAHFKPTRLHDPAYAAAGLPFRWMMKPAGSRGCEWVFTGSHSRARSAACCGSGW